MAQLWLMLTLALVVCRYRTLGFQKQCRQVTHGSCSSVGIRFLLFTRSNREKGELMGPNKIPNLFNVNNPTKVLIHGYSVGISSLFSIRNAYLSSSDYNVIMVDWNKISRSPCYKAAVHNTQFAAKCIAEMIRTLKQKRQKLKRVHLIGYNLGAHVAGITANFLGPLELHRITGLDPAKPLLVKVSNYKKLDSGDARFVEVIHTNSFWLGTPERSGDLDVYMNGGVMQPGCKAEKRPQSCSHHRAVEYFAESILSKTGFWAWRCGDLMKFATGLCPPKGQPLRVGEYVKDSARGTYICRTNASPPYAQGRWSKKNSYKLMFQKTGEAVSSVLNALKVFGPRFMNH